MRADPGNRRHGLGALALVLLAALTFGSTPGAEDAGAESAGAASDGPIVRVSVTGALLPVTADYLGRALEEAGRLGARLVLIELDTPGGLVTSVREMVADMLDSEVPVAVYVAPSGASAASGGVFLVLASDVAAMAPVSDLGAAHPVFPGGQNVEGDIMLDKAENELSAFARALAEQRGRNAELAELMVRESRSFSSQEAVQNGLVELIAESRDALLSALQGRVVARPDGREVTLDLDGATVLEVEPTVREVLLGVLSQPAVAFFLLAIGLLGVYAEINNPGALLPGIVGIICLLLFGLASQVIPVNWIGVGLVALGLGLLILEVYVVSYGALTVAGMACIVIGSLVLFDTPPSLRLPRAVIVSTAVAIGLIAIFLARLAVRSQRAPHFTGREALVGMQGEAVTDLSPGGKVLVHGEYYDARCEATVPRGGRIEVLALDGRELRVGPVRESARTTTQRG